MKRHLFLLMIFPLIVKCQCFVSSVDTFSCSTGDLLMLDADVSGAFDTENYTISNIPFMPISEGSLKSFPLLIEDDQTLGPFPIGFNFNFFNQQYTEFYICSNGFVSFLPVGSPYNSVNLPDANAPKASIFVSWEDWNPSNGQGAIKYETFGVIPNRFLVISYDSINSYNCGGGNQAGDWQIILKENSNEIELHISQKPLCNTINSVQGIQDHNGLNSYTIPGRNDTTWTSYNEAFLFSPNIVPEINWYDPNGTFLTSGITAQLFPVESGDYIVELSNSSGCFSTDTFHIQVSYPSPTINQNGAVLLCNEVGYSYQWFLDGIAIDSAISQFYIPIESGSYQVSTTDINYCEVISDSLLYNFVGIEEQPTGIKIFPNPSSDATLNIELATETVVKIYNARGLLLDTKKIQSGTNRFDLKYNKGIYYLIFSNEENFFIKKWIVF